MRTAHAILYVAVVMCLAGAGVYASDTVPEEVRRKYPEDRYIVRSGMGETSEQAAEAARFEIAKFFESKISGETLVSQWAQSKTSRGKTIENQFAEISNTIIVGASRDIPGIEIATTEHDKRSKIYEAWAVLEKNRYAAVLRERIQRIDRNVDEKLSKKQDSDLVCVRIFSGIMRDLVLRQQSTQDLFLLDAGPAATVRQHGESAFDPRGRLLNAVMTSLDSLIAEAFDVGIVFEGDVKDNIKSGIIQGVVDAGIRLREYPDQSSAVEDDSDLVMLVEHEVSTRTTSYRERVFHIADWVLSVKVSDPSTQEIIDAFVQNDRIGGAQNERQAVDRMVRKILQSQVPNITSWVYKVIFKPDPPVKPGE